MAAARGIDTPAIGAYSDSNGCVRHAGFRILWAIYGRDGQRASGLLGRGLTVPAPNRRWLPGFTHVATWPAVGCAAFIVEICSRAVAG